MKKITVLTSAIFLFATVQSQTKNFIDQPFMEVAGHADTLVTPDEIFIAIKISERDTKDKVSLEEMESKMIAALIKSGIDVEKQLTTSDMASSYKTYFLKKKDILQSKEYILKVADAVTAIKVFTALEEIEISNA